MGRVGGGGGGGRECGGGKGWARVRRWELRAEREGREGSSWT